MRYRLQQQFLDGTRNTRQPDLVISSAWIQQRELHPKSLQVTTSGVDRCQASTAESRVSRIYIVWTNCHLQL
uniref:Uncharacterized protein n=1 Tax=Arundo donax TaxID=35708 RepID=A0A0A9E9Q4_ARUDO